MSELKQMGETLTELALSFTHPQFSDNYPEWSTVFNIGEELIAMGEPELNENQEIVLEWLKRERNDYDLEWGLINALHNVLAYSCTSDEESRAINALSFKEELQVMNIFCAWVLDQC